MVKRLRVKGDARLTYLALRVEMILCGSSCVYLYKLKVKGVGRAQLTLSPHHHRLSRSPLVKSAEWEAPHSSQLTPSIKSHRSANVDPFAH